MPADELLDRLHKRRPPATSDKEENDDPTKKIPTETTTEHGTDEKQDDENALTVNQSSESDQGRRAADPLHQQHPGETGHTSGGQAGRRNHNSSERNATETLLWYQTLDIILLLIELFVKYCPIVGVSSITQNCSNK